MIKKIIFVFVFLSTLLGTTLTVQAGVGGTEIVAVGEGEDNFIVDVTSVITTTAEYELLFDQAVTNPQPGEYEITLYANRISETFPENILSSSGLSSFILPDPIIGNNLVRVIVEASGEQQQFTVETFSAELSFIYNPLNLVKDGSMARENIDSWRSWGRPSPQVIFEKFQPYEPEDFEEVRVMHLTTNGVNGGMQQLNIPVEAGKTYRLDFSYRLLSGKLKPLLGIHSSNVDFVSMADTLLQPTSGDEWWGYARHFTVPDNFQGDFRLVFILQNGESYLDNVSISDITDRRFWYNSGGVDPDGLIRDPYMWMGGLAHWRFWSTPVQVEKRLVQLEPNVYDDYLYLNSLGTGSGIQQLNIPVKAGKKYRLHYSTKLLSGTLRPILGIRTSNVDFEGINTKLKSVPGAGPDDPWKDWTRDFTVPENFQKDFRIAFVLRNGEAYFDNIYLEEISNPNIASTGQLALEGIDFYADEIPVVTLGAGNVQLGYFTLKASAEEVVRVEKLKFDISNSQLDPLPFLRYHLLLNGDEVANSVSPEFDNLNVEVPRGESVNLKLLADIGLAADGTQASLSFFDVYLNPNTEDSVVAFGKSSGVRFAGHHLVYGERIDRDESLFGGAVNVLYANIFVAKGADGPQFPPAVSPDEKVMHLRVTNLENADNFDAFVSGFSLGISSYNFQTQGKRKIRIYRDKILPENMVGEMNFEQQDFDGLFLGPNFFLDTETVEIESGTTVDFYITMDLQDVVEFPFIIVNVNALFWSDGQVDPEDINGLFSYYNDMPLVEYLSFRFEEEEEEEEFDL